MSTKQSRTFRESSIYLFKVLRAHLDVLLEVLCPQMSKLALKPFLKHDSLFRHKILYRMTLTDQSSYIPSHDKGRFDVLMKERITATGADWKSVATTLLADSESVDWRRAGVYRLMPEKPLAHEGVWTYTRIVFHGGVVVDVGSSNLKLTDRWALKQNWSIKRATLCSPADDPIPFSKSCWELFKGKPDFVSFFNTHTLQALYEKEQGESIAKDNGAIVPSADEKPPANLRTSLSVAQRKALVGLKALTST